MRTASQFKSLNCVRNLLKNKDVILGNALPGRSKFAAKQLLRTMDLVAKK